MERTRLHGDAPEKRLSHKPMSSDRLSERVDGSISDLTERYCAVMLELQQLRARPGILPCEGHISDLSRQATRLRIQLQKLRAARETRE